MNDAPTTLQFIPNTLVKDSMIPESMSVGEAIGSLEGVDPDVVDKLSFVLVEDGAGLFRLSNNTKCGPTNVVYPVQCAKPSVDCLSNDVCFDRYSTNLQ